MAESVDIDDTTIDGTAIHRPANIISRSDGISRAGDTLPVYVPFTFWLGVSTLGQRGGGRCCCHRSVSLRIGDHLSSSCALGNIIPVGNCWGRPWPITFACPASCAIRRWHRVRGWGSHVARQFVVLRFGGNGMTAYRPRRAPRFPARGWSNGPCVAGTIEIGRTSRTHPRCHG